MKLTLQIALIIILLLPAATAQGNFSGSYNGTTSGTTSLTGGSFGQIVVSERTVASRDSQATTTTQIDFDMLGDIFSGSTIMNGTTRLEWGFSCQLQPTGVGAATCTATLTTDFATVPNVSPDGCGQISHAQPVGGVRESFYAESHCDLSGGPFQGSGNVTCTISFTSSTGANCWWEIHQLEIYSVQTSSSALTGTFTGTANGTLQGTFTNGTGGGNVTLTDHNVTIIDGDTNLPEMRVLMFVLIIILIFTLLAEWKQDMGWYSLASLATFALILDFPSFLAEIFRVLLIAFGLFLVLRIVSIATRGNSPLREKE